MQYAIMRRIKHIHFVGIAGSGMAGIAEVLLREGYQVSGSDLVQNEVTVHLGQCGALIYQGHHGSYVDHADVVVQSAAIDAHNPELIAARQQRIPIISRAQMLAELMRFRYGIAIAGSHGKTTTTSLMASIFSEAQLDPTFVIGGRLNSIGSHGQLGRGHYLIAEADESDKSFLHLLPMVSVVTNIDTDHLANYDGDFNQLCATFLQFIHRLPFYGLAVLCVDDPVVAKLLSVIARPVLTYGIDVDADLFATDCHHEQLMQSFTVTVAKTGQIFPIKMAMPGRHNTLNALACIGVALEIGIDVPAIQRALDKFQGVQRRFSVYDPCAVYAKKVVLIDDYGHHPRELMVTFTTVQQAFPARRVVWIFQPHRYTRTRDLLKEFCQVLCLADQLIVLDVYSAGESPIDGATGRDLIDAVKQQQPHAYFAANFVEASALLRMILEDNDVLLIQGAGSVADWVESLVRLGYAR